MSNPSITERYWRLNYAFRIIFELIKGEMGYVRDLENIEMVRDDVLVTG